MCLGLRRNKDTGTATQAQLTASFVALFLVGFVLQLSRNTIRRCPRPGTTTSLLACLAVLLSCCTDTAAPCNLSIFLRDEFGDLTSVARLGGTLHIFCEGVGSKTLWVRYKGTKKEQYVPASPSFPPNELVVDIGNRSSRWKSQKHIFADNPIKCKCDAAPSRETRIDEVPHPILCSAGNRITCQDGEICSVDADTETPECTKRIISGCDRRMQVMKTTTFLCPRLDDVPLMECENIQKPTKEWPEFEIPRNDRTECSGQS